MSREYFNLSDVMDIQDIFKFRDVILLCTHQMYYDTMLYCLSLVKRKDIVMPKSSIESNDSLNFRKLVNFTKDYPDRYTNGMINSVEEVMYNHIRDISESTAMALNKNT